MTASLSSTLAVPTTSATPTVRAAAVPCAARPGTSFQHPDGRCRCFVGGPAPQLATPPHPHPHPHPRSRPAAGPRRTTAG